MKLVAIAALLASTCALPAMAQDIDTTAAFTGNWAPFGSPDTSTFGQTFTVGSETVLQSFSLYLDGEPLNPFDYRAYVYAWNGERATGPALYTSGVRQFTGSAPGPNQGSPEEELFGTGGVALVSGVQYVAFLSTAGLQSASYGGSLMPYSGSFGSQPYSGGDFVLFNAGNNFDLLTTTAWDLVGGAGDVWFKADFSDASIGVPEPATWGLMIGGFGLAGGALRRSKQRIASPVPRGIRPTTSCLAIRSI